MVEEAMRHVLFTLYSVLLSFKSAETFVNGNHLYSTMTHPSFESF